MENWEEKGKSKTKVTPRLAENAKEHINDYTDKIKEGKGGEIHEMVIHLLQAGLTVYTLSYLDLSYNNIGENGATAIAKALETNTTLSSLESIAYLE